MKTRDERTVQNRTEIMNMLMNPSCIAVIPCGTVSNTHPLLTPMLYPSPNRSIGEEACVGHSFFKQNGGAYPDWGDDAEFKPWRIFILVWKSSGEEGGGGRAAKGAGACRRQR